SRIFARVSRERRHVVPAAEHAPVGERHVFRVHFPRPVHRSQYLVLAKFNESRAVGIFHCADSNLYFAELVHSPPVCPFSIFIYQISCLSHFSSSASNSPSTSSMVASSGLGTPPPPSASREASCC